MKILETRALRGPNYWSNSRPKVIVLRLDLEDYEDKPTNAIPDFLTRFKLALPTIESHRCSYDEPGGFWRRVEEGTWAGHVIEHIALELQTLAGMDTGYGRTRSTSTKGVYNVVFSYLEEKAGVYTAKAAVDIFLALAEGISMPDVFSAIAGHIQRLREIREDVRFGPSTGSIVEEAARRGIPYIRLNAASLVQLGYGKYQQRIQATTTCRTNMIATDLACDKNATKVLLGSMGVPVPKGYLISEPDEIEDAVDSVGFPVVVKPLDANHGKGITVNLRTMDAVKAAFEVAKQYADDVIIEKFIHGKDFRALVVNNKLVAVAERTPAHIVGDGEKTVKELIDLANRDSRRGYGHENVLTLIDLNDHTLDLLTRKGYSPNMILADGEIFYLKSTANLSTGGTATDRTDEVHPYNVFLCERIARLIGLDIAGIDIVAEDITTPLIENGGAIVEVNAAPGFRMHLAPSEGIARNVAEHVVEMLFPPGAPSRIPIIAVTGTNGKTTTTRLIAHIMKGVGNTVGYTTTDGVYIGNNLVESGDNTGPVSAQMVLKDPTVDLAVLETARGGILRAGLGFDMCDIGVVMNVTADHLGLRDIDTLDDMARVKAVVARSVKSSGTAVLNADDERVYAMKEEVDCAFALFSMDESNPRIQRHTLRGGVACVYENGYVSILKGSWKIRVEKVINIPLTLSGRAAFMIQNVLAATLAVFAHGVKTEDIRVGLTTFVPSPAQTPGRLNLFEIQNFTVIVDYAHNPAGLEALHKVLDKFPNPKKTGIIGGTGDRRDDDIRLFGQIAARMFTHLIVREDDNRRGRKSGEATELVIEGIRSEKPEMPVQQILSEADAITTALKKAKKGELVVILADDVRRAITLVSQFREAATPIAFEPGDIPNQPMEFESARNAMRGDEK